MLLQLCHQPLCACHVVLLHASAQKRRIGHDVGLELCGAHLLQPLPGVLHAAQAGITPNDRGEGQDVWPETCTAHGWQLRERRGHVAGLRVRVDYGVVSVHGGMHVVASHLLKLRVCPVCIAELAVAIDHAIEDDSTDLLLPYHVGEPPLCLSHLPGRRAGADHRGVTHGVGPDTRVTHRPEPPDGPLHLARLGARGDDGVVAHDVRRGLATLHVLQPSLCTLDVPRAGAGPYHGVVDYVCWLHAVVYHGGKVFLRPLGITHLVAAADHCTVAVRVRVVGSLVHVVQHTIQRSQLAGIPTGVQQRVVGLQVRLEVRPLHLREPPLRPLGVTDLRASVDHGGVVAGRIQGRPPLG
mmetsp:Transcript_38883/g.120987  ORF Transcript_38883/g.120987 Transcript_38883/m.120987 type:complete len:354 (-) Transcript_38883:140-1201(-)